MDKPRRPQVVRPWKIQPSQKSKVSARGFAEQRHGHESKIEIHWKKAK